MFSDETVIAASEQSVPCYDHGGSYTERYVGIVPDELDQVSCRWGTLPPLDWVVVGPCIGKEASEEFCFRHQKASDSLVVTANRRYVLGESVALAVRACITQPNGEA